jgi:hypothetical protein
VTKDEALKLALEVLEEGVQGTRPLGVATLEAIATIKEALAQPEQEPAACKECHLKDTVYDLLGDLKVANLKLSVRAQRTWVEVTDEEREQVINANTATGLWYMAKDIEAKLKEKNT